jgi:hypothetical protein
VVADVSGVDEAAAAGVDEAVGLVRARLIRVAPEGEDAPS